MIQLQLSYPLVSYIPDSVSLFFSYTLNNFGCACKPSNNKATLLYFPVTQPALPLGREKEKKELGSKVPVKLQGLDASAVSLPGAGGMDTGRSGAKKAFLKAWRPPLPFPSSP